MSKAQVPAKKLLSFFLVLILTLSLVPAASVKAYAGDDEGENDPINEISVLSTSREIFALDDTVPKNADKVPSAFNGEPGDPFLLLEKDELYFYRSHDGGYNSWILDTADSRYTSIDGGNVWLKGFNFTTAKSVKDLFNTSNAQASGMNNNPVTKMSFVQGVSFDPTGSGKRDHVALTGYQDGKVMVYVQNASTGATVSIELGEAGWMQHLPLPVSGNYFSITAGDYDGDGKDTAVVYYCGDNDARIFEVKLSGSSLSKDLVSILSMDAFTSSDYLGWMYDAGTVNDPSKKPIVSLATGDLNGDGVDQLAYLAGFHNPDGSVADGYDRDFSSLDYFAASLVLPQYDSTADFPWIIDRDTMMIKLYEVGDIDSASGDTVQRKVSILHGGALTAGDMDADGRDELLAVSYADIDQARAAYRIERDANGNKTGETLTHVKHICNWDPDEWAYCVIQDDGSGYTRSAVNRMAMNRFTGAGFYHEDERVFPRPALECARSNGVSSPADVFVSGNIYNFSDKDYPRPVYETNWFNNDHPKKVTGGGDNKPDATFQWVRSVTAGNFDKNDAGREQFVFTLFFKRRGEEQYSANLIYMGGTDYQDKTGSDGSFTHGAPKYYGTNANASDYINESHLFIDGDDPKGSQLCNCSGWSFNDPMNFVPLAVCTNDDSMLGREKGFAYLYTDPQVEAVMQAAPYFAELNELGGHDEGETSYTIETSFGTAAGSSYEASWSAGYAGEVEAGIVDVQWEIGYQGSFSEEFEDSLSKTYSTSFSGADEDVVVISRVPILINSYDVWVGPTYDDDGALVTSGHWVDGGYNVNVPLEPVYFLLSVDDYNDFVDEYNARLTTDVFDDQGNKIYDHTQHQLTLLSKITAADLADGHIGNPENYWSDWDAAGEGGDVLSKQSYNCGTSVNGSTTSEWSSEAESTYTRGTSHGLHVELSVQLGGNCKVFGFGGETWHGAALSTEHAWGRSTSTTKAVAFGTSGSVNNINRSALLDQDIPVSTINSYGFSWTFGMWTRQLTGDDDPYAAVVPFFGYAVSDVRRPLRPPVDVEADGTGLGIDISWKASPSEGAAGYKVYLMVHRYDQLHLYRHQRKRRGRRQRHRIHREGGNRGRDRYLRDNHVR